MVLNSSKVATFYDQNEIQSVATKNPNCVMYPSFCKVKTEAPLERICYGVCHNLGYNRNMWIVFGCCCCYNIPPVS